MTGRCSSCKKWCYPVTGYARGTSPPTDVRACLVVSAPAARIVPATGGVVARTDATQREEKPARRHLLTTAALPNVTVQVLPFSKGAHAGLNGPFAILEFPGPDPDVVYVDSAAGNIYPPEKADQTRGYTLAFDHLRATALSPTESKAFLEQVG